MSRFVVGYKTYTLIIVGMLACQFDVRIGFDRNLTVLSAVVAFGFTFAVFAMASPYISGSIQHSRGAKVIAASFRMLRGCIFSCCPESDVEAGYKQLSAEEHEQRSQASLDAELQRQDEEEEARWQVSDPYSDLGFPERQSINCGAFYEAEMALPLGSEQVQSPQIARPVTPEVVQSGLLPQRGRPTGLATMGRSKTHPEAQSTTLKSPPFIRRRSLPRPTPVIMSSESPVRETLSSSSSYSSLCSSPLRPRPRANSGTGSNLSGTTARTQSSQYSGCWGDVQVGLSREARMRIRASAQDRPPPVFGWGYWLREQWRMVTVLVAVRAVVWGLALVMMHYCGEFWLCGEINGARRLMDRKGCGR